MKYFTLDWWCGSQSGEILSDPAESYRRHVDAIRGQLTPDLLRLEDDVSLHDGVLRRVRLDASGRELQMIVDTDNGSGGTRSLRLRYCGVSVFESLANVDRGLPGPAGYGDLGYLEVHVAGHAFEHCFLFSTGIELRVQFRTFQLEDMSDCLS